MIHELNVQELHGVYRSVTESPFPHIVLDNIWDDQFLDSVRSEVEGFSDWAGEKHFYGSMYKRFQFDWTRLPSNTSKFLAYLNSPSFLKILEGITGELALIPDPYLEGGGIHSIGNGGFLKLHADFNWHERMQVYRRLNVLVYLNKNWDDGFKGHLQLASKDAGGQLTVEKSLAPIFNRTVIFTTDDHSYHGHPEPLQTPEHVRRNSIATYYYQAEKPKGTAEVKRKATSYADASDRAPMQSFLARLLNKVR